MLEGEKEMNYKWAFAIVSFFTGLFLFTTIHSWQLLMKQNNYINSYKNLICFYQDKLGLDNCTIPALPRIAEILS